MSALLVTRRGGRVGTLPDQRWRDTRTGRAAVEYLSWLRLGGAAPRTLASYEWYLARGVLYYLDDLGRDMGFAEWTSNDMLTVAALVPTKSQRAMVGAWHRLFKWGIQWDHVIEDPTVRLPRIRAAEPPLLKGMFTQAERAKILAAAGRSLLPARNRLAVLCLHDLGIRKGELRRLTPQDFDTASRSVVVLGKGSKERAIPYSEDIHLALLDFMATKIPAVRHVDPLEARVKYRTWVEDRLPQPGDYLMFPAGVQHQPYTSEPRILWTDPSRSIVDSALHNWWVRLLEDADVEYRHMHINRHTFGSDSIASGTDLTALADLLGHRDTRITQRYVHNDRTRLRGAIDALTAARAISDDE